MHSQKRPIFDFIHFSIVIDNRTNIAPRGFLQLIGDHVFRKKVFKVQLKNSGIKIFRGNNFPWRSFGCFFLNASLKVSFKSFVTVFTCRSVIVLAIEETNLYTALKCQQ